MGFIDKLLGNAAAEPVKAIGRIIDDIHTSGEERADANQKLVDVAAKLQSLQAEITAKEAQHRSIFIAGWRPGLAWLCIFILAFNYVIVPVSAMFGYDLVAVADPEHIENIVMTLCGVATLRTVEKKLGLTK